MGGVNLASQLIGCLAGVLVAFVGGSLVYGLLRFTVGIRLTAEEEHLGADLAIHRIRATPAGIDYRTKS